MREEGRQTGRQRHTYRKTDTHRQETDRDRGRQAEAEKERGGGGFTQTGSERDRKRNREKQNTAERNTYEAGEEGTVLEVGEGAGDCVGEDEEDDGEEKDVRLVVWSVTPGSNQLSSHVQAHLPGHHHPVRARFVERRVPGKVVAGSNRRHC